MKKEIKIEDFVSSEELESMSKREREIYESAFQLKKKELQGLVDAQESVDRLKDKLNK